MTIRKVGHLVADVETPFPTGVRTIRVILTSPTPRVMAFVRYDTQPPEPVSVFVDEIASAITAAQTLFASSPT